MILTQIEGVAAGDEVVDGLFRQCRYLCSLSLAMIAVLAALSGESVSKGFSREIFNQYDTLRMLKLLNVEKSFNKVYQKGNQEELSTKRKY